MSTRTCPDCGLRFTGQMGPHRRTLPCRSRRAQLDAEADGMVRVQVDGDNEWAEVRKTRERADRIRASLVAAGFDSAQIARRVRFVVIPSAHRPSTAILFVRPWLAGIEAAWPEADVGRGATDALRKYTVAAMYRYAHAGGVLRENRLDMVAAIGGVDAVRAELEGPLAEWRDSPAGDAARTRAREDDAAVMRRVRSDNAHRPRVSANVVLGGAMNPCDDVGPPVYPLRSP